MNITANEILDLLNSGVRLANEGDKTSARRCFRNALRLDPHNETAVLWLAYLSPEPSKAVELLEDFIALNPTCVQAQTYLQQAQDRVNELDQLVSSSATLNSWTSSKKANGSRAIPFLGEYLLRQGIITQQQLEMALRRHKDLANRGNQKLVGQVMVELGYISQVQLDGWLQQQSGDYSIYFRD